MKRGMAAAALAPWLILLGTASCRTAPEAGPDLLRLREGAAAPAVNARITGKLIRDGACLAFEGNGTTVVIWVRSSARTSPGNGNTVVIWPRSATLRQDGIGTVIVVWPRGTPSNPPLRIGERAELTGALVDDVATLPLEGGTAGCHGRGFVVSAATP